MPLRLYVIKPVEEREQGHRHPVQDAIRATPEYLPDPTLMTQQLHRWRLRHVREFLPSVRRCVRERRAGIAASDPHDGRPARPRPPGPARTARASSTSRNCCRPSRSPTACSTRPTSATCTRTSRTARRPSRGSPPTITGLPFSFTGHARDIYSWKLNRKGWLRRKLLAARFVVTCTEANVRHLKRIAPEANGPPRLPRPVGGLHRSAGAAATKRRSATATCGSSASAGSSPRRASTRSSTPAPSCATAASRSTR